MKKYIDADKLTFSRVRIIHSDGTAGGWNAVVMSSVINNAPTADVVEVVRCKDCANSKHWYADKRRCFLWHETGIGVFENDYCSYGERREE